MKCFLDAFDSLEAAQAANLQAKFSHPWLEPQVHQVHLPGPDYTVPGGMYPATSETAKVSKRGVRKTQSRRCSLATLAPNSCPRRSSACIILDAFRSLGDAMRAFGVCLLGTR